MPILAAAPLIGAAGSIIGGLLGSSSAEKAARQAAAADQAAATGVSNATTAGQADITAGQQAADTAIASGVQQAQGTISGTGQQQASLYGTELGQVGNATGALQPYQTAGRSGLTSLANMAGTFSAPTAAQAAATPGYQFELAQGLKAVNNNAATSGMLQSGANMKANAQYAEGLASTNYQQAYNNSLGTFNENQTGYQTLANLGTQANSQALQGAGLNLSAGSTYGGQLTSLANLGTNTSLQGASMLSNTALQGNEDAAALGLQGATTAGNFLTNAGNAQAAGTAGAGNAWTSAINGGFNSVLGGLNSMQNTGATGGVYQGNGSYLGTGSNPISLPGYGAVPVGPGGAGGVPVGPGT